MPKTHSHSDEKVREAAKIMNDCGIYLSVPGWFGISTPDEAVYFAQDPDRYYDDINKKEQKRKLEEVKRMASKEGASLEDYLHYLKFSHYYRYEEIGAEDANLAGGQCTALTKKGKPCKNFFHFDGTFKQFKKGVSDKCKIHRKKKETVET